MTLPLTALQSILDTYLPNTGTIGYIALIQNVVHSSTYTVDSSTDVITLATTPTIPLVSGCRFRVTNSGGAIPGVSGTALNTSTDYFWIAITTTTGKLARTLADAVAGSPVPIDFVNNGTGTQTITEQALNATAANPDPLSVVLSKELPAGGGYTVRQAVTNIGAAAIVSNRAEKNITFTLTGDSTGYVYRYFQLILGGTSAIGNTTGTQSYLTAESSNITVNSGSPRFIFLRNALQSP